MLLKVYFCFQVSFFLFIWVFDDCLCGGVFVFVFWLKMLSTHPVLAFPWLAYFCRFPPNRYPQLLVGWGGIVDRTAFSASGGGVPNRPPPTPESSKGTGPPLPGMWGVSPQGTQMCGLEKDLQSHLRGLVVGTRALTNRRTAPPSFQDGEFPSRSPRAPKNPRNCREKG